jgi:hypothetical protein
MRALKVKHSSGRFASGMVAVALAGIVLSGCPAKSDFSPEQQETMGRAQSIAAYSNGDWARVKPEDKKFLISGPGSGSESSAKMFLSSIAKPK